VSAECKAVAALRVGGFLGSNSTRIPNIADPLEQNVPREDVQHLAGHADPHTTNLYDRRKRKVSRNIVKTISV